jgi:sugar lactone lactonase YvrE
MDSEGGVWSARWQSGKIVRFDPEGKITVEIDLPTAWHVTCLIFGGPDLKDLYATTAATDHNGEIIPERCDGGDLFVVRDLGYTGVERSRFKDKF